MRVIVTFCLFVLSFFSQATSYHAIVVGVSEYPGLPEELSLTGPKYDALRVKSMLLQQGVDEENIQLLADGVQASPLPTKANILSAFRALEKSLERGDFVYLHFSGHGSQQPALAQGAGVNRSDGTDGLDEIFLPRDIGEWSRTLGTVENSLTDNEMEILLNRLRNKGANVWVVFDSCHSGTMTRSLTGQEFRSRSIRPQDIGLDAEESESGRSVSQAGAPGTVSLEKVELKSDAGALISFGAAQSNEEAPEMKLPSGEESLPQGLFTYTLTSLISQNPNLSYRQLAQSVLSAYNSMPWHRTTPLFEGGAELDLPVFHREGEVAVRYPVSRKKGRFQIQAGQLNGLEKGALVDVYLASGDEESVAVLEIVRADISSSEAELREGEVSSKTSFAELTSPAYPAPLRVNWQADPGQQWKNAASALLNENDLLKRTVVWVGENEEADISLYAESDKLYFFTMENESLPCGFRKDNSDCGQNQGDETYLSVPVDMSNPQPYATINNGLSRLVRAHNLKRLSATMSGKSQVVSELYLNDEPRMLDQIVRASDGDELYVSFVNRGRKPVDLTVMFMDSGMGIYQVFPEPGYSGRLFAGEAADFEGTVTSSTTGEEQFIVIAIPASRESPQISLSHLQQEPMESATFYQPEEQMKVATRGRGSVEDIFASSLGDAPQTRAFKKKEKSAGKASISVIRLKTD